MQNLAKLWTNWERQWIDFRGVFGPTGRTRGRNMGRHRGKMYTSGTLKILPKSSPGGSPGHPRALPEPSPGDPEHRKRTAPPKGRQKVAKVARKSAPRASRGSPKILKNRPGRGGTFFLSVQRPHQKAPEAFFFDFWHRRRWKSLSGPISARFFTKNHMKIEHSFRRERRDFFDRAMSRIVQFLHIETHFFHFRVFAFFGKKTSKK